MKLSVIIVNYNVKQFLEQCLISVEQAAKHVPCEIFVVDNCSVDGSTAMVNQKFPAVTLIANQKNLGFSKANNQAIKLAQGEYILLLNPDAVVEELTFKEVINFMDQHHDAGGLGVKMIDGKGAFLPESKRGLPTPAVAFYKIFGLSSIFPKSKRFGQYHLGYLPINEVNEIDVLSGAFMLMRKKALDEVGLLDEDFFMYGEDIDLSYRIKKGGYKNYYFPHTKIIHYKGESTKKSSVNYVFIFYRAMVIFARKHFSAKHAKTFSFLINMAIYFRAALAIFTRTIKKSWLFAFDYGMLLLGLYCISSYYSELADIQFKSEIIIPAITSYPLIWIVSCWLSGGYDQPMSKRNLLKGVFSGTILVLIIYSLMPETLRFSRAVVLLGAFFGTAHYLLSRVVLSWLLPKLFYWKTNFKKHFLIVAKTEEFNRINELLKETNIPVSTVTQYLPDENIKSGDNNYHRWDEMLTIKKINEVIFSAKDLDPTRIMSLMAHTSGNNIDFKIAPPKSLYIIGSNSIHQSGEMYMVETNTLNQTKNKRNKRMFDLLVSLGCLLSLPVSIWMVKKPIGFIQNMLEVIVNKKTWVGIQSPELVNEVYPKYGNGVISPGEHHKPEAKKEVELQYLKNYHINIDWQIFSSNFLRLGKR